MSAFDQILNDSNRLSTKNTQPVKPKTSKKKLIGIYLPIEIIAQVKKLSYETDKKVNDIYLEIIKKGLVD